jgi:hypothetical protein
MTTLYQGVDKLSMRKDIQDMFILTVILIVAVAAAHAAYFLLPWGDMFK